MIPIMLALASSVAYGAADFLGGFVNRRAPLLAVVATGQLVGFALLLPAVTLLFHDALVVDAIGWGLAGGIASSTGVALLYHGLAVGTMSVVAPVAGLLAASVPVAWGVVLGERPSPLAVLGIVVVLGAIFLVSRPRAEESAVPARRGVAAGVGAGVAFGCAYVLLAGAGPAAGLWPVLFSRVAAVGLMAVGAVVTRSTLRLPKDAMAGAASTGALDTAANALYVLAANTGMISLVAVLASLYPASTVVLARVVLRERLGHAQVSGLALGAVGAVLIAAG